MKRKQHEMEREREKPCRVRWQCTRFCCYIVGPRADHRDSTPSSLALSAGQDPPGGANEVGAESSQVQLLLRGRAVRTAPARSHRFHFTLFILGQFD